MHILALFKYIHLKDIFKSTKTNLFLLFSFKLPDRGPIYQKKTKHANVFRFQILTETRRESHKILIPPTNDKSIAISSEHFFKIGFSREIYLKKRDLYFIQSMKFFKLKCNQQNIFYFFIKNVSFY